MSSSTLRRRTTFRAVGKHKPKGSHPILRVLIVLFVGITMFTSGASAASIFFYGNNLPGFKDFKQRFEYQNTLIRASDGSVLYDMADLSRASRGSRVVEPLQMPGHSTAAYRADHEDWLVGTSRQGHLQPGIPLALQDATIATEDATFYSNPGFDPLSIVRAAYDDATKGHVVSGASTITQQLVRAYMLNPSPTLSRKTEEIVLSAELTQKYPKTKILWYYLNSIPYGNFSIGAEAAAKTYFRTDVWNLDAAQCALLAGLPQAPSQYDPVNNRQAALERMQEVLQLEYKHGYLRDAQGKPDYGLIATYMKEAERWPRFEPPVAIRRFPHFTQYAVDQLEQIAQVTPSLKGKIYDGLDVWTSINPKLQNVAQSIVSNQISQLGSYNVTDGALVSMSLDRACYGCVLAMVGSPNYRDVKHSGQINMADSPRQPGSSFKPFNYVLGFENGLAPATSVLDGPIAIPDQGNPEDGGLYEPKDYDLTWHGVVTLRTALDNSLNVPAVKVEQFNAAVSSNGLQAIEDMAYRMGMKSIKADNPHCCGWSLTLGGMERGVRLVEETAAYGAFGTEGHPVPPVAIVRVYDRTTHKLLYNAAPNMKASATGPTVIDPAYAYLMDNVLSDNNSRCTPAVCEFGLDSPLYLGRTAAAKTGTTNAFTDNWTVGYTPDIVTGVWVGNADNAPMVGTTGVTGAAPIWHDFMLKAFQILNLPPKDFVQPSGVYYGSQCRIPGPYTSFSAMGYDLYAGTIPYCSVGTSNAILPAPQQYTAPPTAAAYSVPTPTPPSVAATVAAIPTSTPIPPAAVATPTPPAPAVQSGPNPTPTPLPLAPATSPPAVAQPTTAPAPLATVAGTAAP
jgi:membrane peptidoglycan carboxypeptidase